MIGVLGAVPEVALLSLLKLEWAPATKPQVHSFMLFISHTHTHTHTHTHRHKCYEVGSNIFPTLWIEPMETKQLF